MIPTARFAALTLAFFLLPQALRATDSSLDASFVTTISPGLTPTSYPTFTSGTAAVNAVALQSDGSILAGGNVSRYQTSGGLSALKRVLPSGALDTTFNPGGGTGLATSTGQPEVNRLLVDSLDRIYVAGTFDTYDGTNRSCILRLLANGNLDTSFTPTGMGGSARFGRALALQTDGKLLVGGVFSTLNGTFRKHIARLNTDGTLDTSFDPNTALATCNSVFDIAIQPDGKILVGGTYSRGGYESGQLLTRLNPDGSLDASFVAPFANTTGNVQEIALLPDGRVVLTGFLELAAPYADAYIACLHPDGSIDTTFMANMGSGPAGWAGGNILIQPDGAIIIMGRFLSFDGSARAPIARLFPDGTLDTSFTPLPYAPDNGTNLTHFYTGAIQPDGKLVVGGWFDRVTDPLLETFNLTRIVNEYSPSSPGTLRLLTPTAAVAENAGSITLYVSRFSGLTEAVSVNYSVAGITATAGSDFTTASGTLSWAAGEGGFKSITIPVLQDSTVEGSETFSVTLSSPTGGATLPPSAAQTIVTIRDDDSAPVLTKQPVPVSIEQGAGFFLAITYDSVLAATIQWQYDPDGPGGVDFGDISGATGTTCSVANATPAQHAGSYRARVTNPNGSVFSNAVDVSISVPAGSVDTLTFTSGAPAGISKAVRDAAGRTLAFVYTTPHKLVRLLADGSLDATFTAPEFNSVGSDIAVQSDGKILVAGFFTTVNGVARTGVARLNSDGTLDTTLDLGLSGSGISVAVGAGDKIYVGGSGYSGGLRRFTSAGVLDATFGTSGRVTGIGEGNNGYVWRIQELADGRVMASHQTGSTFYKLQILSATGVVDTSFNVPALNWNIYSWDFLPDGRIAIVGRFSAIDGEPFARIAILNADGSVDPSFRLPLADGPNGPVRGVHYQNGRLIVWGEFSTVGGVPPSGIARFNLDGSIDPNFSIGAGAGLTNNLYPTATGDFDIYGQFTSVKSVPRNYAARIIGNSHIGAVGFAPSRVTTLEANAPLVLTLRRYGPSTEAVSINWTTTDGTAEAGTDYTAATGTVTWAAGDSADKSINLNLLGDGIVEDAETFRVLLDSPSGPVTASALASVTLIDSDTPVTFTAQPTASSTLLSGDALTLTGSTTSPSDTTYQWFFNGTAIVGATTTSLALTDTTAADAGLYTLVATNASGSYTSSVAQVVIAPRPGRVAADQTTVGRPSFSSNPQAILALPDGSALAAGSFTNVNGTGINYLVHVHPDGSLDTSFNLAISNYVSTLYLQPDGKILVGGAFASFGGATVYSFARLNADLTPDTAFNANIGSLYYRFSGTGYNVGANAMDSSGRIYAGVSEVSGATLYRFSAAGVRDTSYAPAVNQSVRALAMQADDKLIVAGYFTSLAGSSASRNGRLNPDGTRDATFSAPFASATVNDLKILADGRIIAAGSLGTMTMAELSNTGTVISNLGSSYQVYRLSQGPTGKIVVVRTGPTPVYRLKGTHPFPSPGSSDGDPTFNIGTGPGGEAFAVDHDADGSIWLAGSFTTFDGFPSGGIVKLIGDPAAPSIVNQPVNAGVAAGETAHFGVGATGSGLTYQWFKAGNPLTDGGDISGATSALLTIANVDLSDDADYSVEVTSNSITVTSDASHLFVLGAPVIATAPDAVDMISGPAVTISAEVYAAAPATYQWSKDGVPLANDARITGVDTASLAFASTTTDDTGTYQLAITNNQGTATTEIYALVRPVPSARVATYAGLSSSNSVTALHALSDGGMLVASLGGSLTNPPQTTLGNRLHLVKSDGTVANLGVSPTNSFISLPSFGTITIRALLQQPDGKILVGGNVSGVGATVMRLLPDGSEDPTFTTLTGSASTASSVFTLALDNSGDILVGGDFTTLAGVSAKNYLVRLDGSTGAIDPSFTPVIWGTVTKILPLTDHGFLVGGSFTSPQSKLLRLDASGTYIASFSSSALAGNPEDLALTPDGTAFYAAINTGNRLFRYKVSDGTLDNSFSVSSGYLNNAVYSIAVQPDGKVLAYGQFNTSPPVRVARFLANGTPDPTFTTTGPNTTSYYPLALDAAGRIWVGGSFTTFAGATANRIAVLEGDVPTLAWNSQPIARFVAAGETIAFSAAARATSPVTYQWYKNGGALSDGGRISGATTDSLSITGATVSDEGNFTVKATSVAAGTIESAPAELTFLAAPEILTAPTGGTFEAGVSRTFTVSARGAGTLSYQWFRGTSSSPIADIVGATSAAYTLAAPAVSDTAYYGVRVTNSLGNVSTTPVLALFASYAGSLAVPASAFPTFANSVNKVIPLAGGAFLAAGSFTSHIPVGGSSSTTPRCFIAITPAGTRDLNYAYINNSGTPTVTAMVRDSQNRTVIAGNFNTFFYGANITRYTLARLAADGSVDTGWNSPFGNVSNSTTTMAVGPSDEIWIGGSFTSVNSIAGTARLARLSATTGAVITTFVSPITSGTVNALHAFSDGSVLVGGTFGLRKLTATGADSPGFTYGGFGSIFAIHPMSDGGFLLGTSNSLQRITSTGALVSPFPATGTSANSTIRAILPMPNGDFLLGGDFTTYNGQTANRIIAVHADGTASSALGFGSGFGGSVNDIALDASGQIYVAGAFTSYQGTTTSRVVILNPTDTIPTDPGAPATATDNLTDFLANAGVPAHLRGPNDDADGDGLANLLEYALDLNPYGNGGAFTGISPSTATTPTHLQFTYRRVRNDVTYLVETCDDLATGSWTSIGVDQGTPAGDGTTTASLPISGGSRFLRLSVSR
jgi:uncharacterized delta-60 repeat protein